MAKKETAGSKPPGAVKCAKDRYVQKRHKYKKKIEDLQGQLGQLEERLKREESLNSKYFDCLEQQGLLCGICMEDVVHDDSLPCCSNRICQGCESKVKDKHKQCPFCRASMVPAGTEQQQVDASEEAGTVGSPRSRFAAAISALMRRSTSSGVATTADAAADAYLDDDSMGSYSEEYNSEYDSEMDDDHMMYTSGQDTTVLLAAAAEAAMAATRGPSGSCGLCGSNWLMSSLATAAELPDMLLCRTCWRNIPELANKPFTPSCRSSSASASSPFRKAEIRPAAAAAGPAPAGPSSSRIPAVGVPGSSTLAKTPAVAHAAVASVSPARNTGKRKVMGSPAVLKQAARSPRKAAAGAAAARMSAEAAADDTSKKKKSKKNRKSSKKQQPVVPKHYKRGSPATVADPGSAAAHSSPRQHKKQKRSRSVDHLW